MKLVEDEFYIKIMEFNKIFNFIVDKFITKIV